MYTRAISLLSFLALANSASAQITLTEIAPPVDLNATFFTGSPAGINPSAIAVEGTTLWVAGFNNQGLVGTTGIVRVDNATTTPAVSTAFAVLTTPGQRGYSGLTVKNTIVGAAFDSGATDLNGIAAYNGTTFAPLWAANTRGICGPGFDPDFNAAGGLTGIGWTTLGAGRRALNDLNSGASYFDLTNGMIIAVTGQPTVWRCMEFDQATGDVYLRMDNFLVKAVRSGTNACAAGVTISGLVTAAGIAGQNVAVLNTNFGTFLLANDRTVATAGQNFFSVVQAFNTNGNATTVQWPGTFTPPTSAGWYDFSYDPASSTLAILDFLNRSVFLFSVGSTQAGTTFCSGDGTGTACPCANSGVAGNGCASSVNPSGANLGSTGVASIGSDSVVLTGSGMPNSSALYFQGTSQQGAGAGTVFGDGLRCAGGTITRLGTKTNVGGGSQYPAAGDPSVSVRGLVSVPGTRTYQIWYRNAAAFCTASTFNLSNGREIVWSL